MYYAESRSFFEISNGPQLENTLQARLLCLKDFLKRCVVFPFALLMKTGRTLSRGMGVCLAAMLVMLTLGGSESAREFFIQRMATLAKDFADWLLLPFAFLGCFFRLILAFLMHPSFYFNGIS